MQILCLLGLVLAVSNPASTGSGLPNSSGQPKIAEIPTVSQVNEKLRDLMIAGVLVLAPDHRVQRVYGPYEGAAASCFAFTEMKRQLATESSVRNDKSNLTTFAKHFHDVEFLLRYYRPLFSALEFELSEEDLHQVATQFARKGFPVQRTLGLRFRDVPEGHWASPAVHAQRDAGILTGYPDAKFRG